MAALKDGQLGRPEGSGRALTPEQEERVKKELVDRTPDQLKLKFALWSAHASPLAHEAMRQIGVLYAIEEQIRGQAPQVRQRVRREQAMPILASLHTWQRQTQQKLSQKSALAEAVRQSWVGQPIGRNSSNLR